MAFAGRWQQKLYSYLLSPSGVLTSSPTERKCCSFSRGDVKIKVRGGFWGPNHTPASKMWSLFICKCDGKLVLDKRTSHNVNLEDVSPLMPSMFIMTPTCSGAAKNASHLYDSPSWISQMCPFLSLSPVKGYWNSDQQSTVHTIIKLSVNVEYKLHIHVATVCWHTTCTFTCAHTHTHTREECVYGQEGRSLYCNINANIFTLSVLRTY